MTRTTNFVTVIFRWLLVIMFVVAGSNHFWDPAFYLPMMPSYLPWHEWLIAISGCAEIAGGIGVAIPATRRFAGWGLIALLVAVFPANLHMALNQVQLPGIHLTALILWLRLPLQLIVMAWVWWVAIHPPSYGERLKDDTHGNGVRRHQ